MISWFVDGRDGDYALAFMDGVLSSYCNASAVRALTRMPRFYFDSDDGETPMTDTIGLDFADLRVAQQEAVRALPEIAKDALPDGENRDFIITVRDGSGPVLRATLSLRVEKLG
jgi:hypothetical protein